MSPLRDDVAQGVVVVVAGLGQARPGQTEGARRWGLARLWSHKALDHVGMDVCAPLGTGEVCTGKGGGGGGQRGARTIKSTGC